MNPNINIQPALVEYERIREQAWAEYFRIMQQASTECDRITQQALVEYERIVQPARGEYNRIVQQAMVCPDCKESIYPAVHMGHVLTSEINAIESALRRHQCQKQEKGENK